MITVCSRFRVLVAIVLVAAAFALALRSAEASTVVAHRGCDLHAKVTEAPAASAITAAAAAHRADASLAGHRGETCSGIGCNVAVPHCPASPQRQGNDSDQVTLTRATAVLGFEPPGLWRPPRE